MNPSCAIQYVLHRIDDLEKGKIKDSYEAEVLHRIDDLEMK